MAPKAPRDRGPFRVGEKVLVPHTDKFYVAKVSGQRATIGVNVMSKISLSQFSSEQANAYAGTERRETGGRLVLPAALPGLPCHYTWAQSRTLTFGVASRTLFDTALPRHAQGWNKKWDEWVEAPGLVKYDQKLVRGDDDKKVPAVHSQTGIRAAAISP